MDVTKKVVSVEYTIHWRQTCQRRPMDCSAVYVVLVAQRYQGHATIYTPK